MDPNGSGPRVIHPLFPWFPTSALQSTQYSILYTVPYTVLCVIISPAACNARMFCIDHSSPPDDALRITVLPVLPGPGPAPESLPSPPSWAPRPSQTRLFQADGSGDEYSLTLTPRLLNTRQKISRSTDDAIVMRIPIRSLLVYLVLAYRGSPPQ